MTDTSDQGQCDEFRTAIIWIERRYQATAEIFSRTHEKLIAELMAYKREMIGDAAAARYQSSLISLLSKETKDRDRFAATIEHQARLIAQLQKKVAISEACGRDVRVRLETELEQLKAARQHDAVDFAQKIAAAGRQVEADMRRIIKASCSKARTNLVELRARLAELRVFVNPAAGFNASLSLNTSSGPRRLPSSSKFRPESDMLTRQPSATLSASRFLEVKSDMPSLAAPLIPPPTVWKPELHDLLRSIRTTHFADAATQCSQMEPLVLSVPPLPLVDASTETETVSPIYATVDENVGGGELTVTVDEGQQTVDGDLQCRLVERLLAAVQGSPTTTNTTEKQQAQEILVPVSSDSDARVAIPPDPSFSDHTAEENEVADKFLRRNLLRRSMVHWLRRQGIRQQKRFGVFLKDRVAAVLGLQLRPDLLPSALLDSSRDVRTPRRPASGQLSVRSARNTVPLETFEAARAALSESRGVDKSIIMMTTSSSRLRARVQ